MKKMYKRFLLFMIIVAVVIGLYYFGLSRYFSLEALKRHADSFRIYVSEYYLFSVLVYMGALFTVIVLALPIVALFALAAGYLFGIGLGLFYSEIAAVLGAVTAFIVYRYFLYKIIHATYHKKLEKLEHEVKKDGASYLLMLQFIGLIPFSVINIVALFADIPLITVVWTTAVGAFPYLLVYVIAGSQLSSIKSLKDLISVRMMGLLILFIVLALIPMVIKRFKKSKFHYE